MTMSESAPPSEASPPSSNGNLNEQPKEIEFHYVKCPLHRVIHVDGCHGGIAPNGESIVITLFSERRPVPTHEVFALNESSQLVSPPTLREVKPGVFRELESTLIMSPTTAHKIVDWLTNKLKQYADVSAKLEQLTAAHQESEHPREEEDGQ